MTAADLATWITPARTTLLIIDMQADFASPDGAAGRDGADLSAVPAALAAARQLAAAARSAGAPVIFVGLETQPETDSAAWRERVRRIGGDAAAEFALCRAGTPGAAFVGPTPTPGEVVIRKTRYSAFHGDELAAVLGASGRDTLVVCGLTTECCVENTVRDAFHRDYHVFLVADACAAYDQAAHAAALKALQHHCAIVTSSDEVALAWRVPEN